MSVSKLSPKTITSLEGTPNLSMAPSIMVGSGFPQTIGDCSVTSAITCAIAPAPGTKPFSLGN